MQSAVPRAQGGAVETDTGTDPLFPCFISYTVYAISTQPCADTEAKRFKKGRFAFSKYFKVK